MTAVDTTTLRDRWCFTVRALSACSPGRPGPYRLTHHESRVALALAEFADAEGHAAPGVERIAEHAEVSRASVTRALRLLECLGLLTRGPRRGSVFGAFGGRLFDDLYLTLPQNSEAVGSAIPTAANR